MKPWNPHDFGDTPRAVNDDGQPLIFFDHSIEPPDPDDFPDLARYEEAWQKWDRTRPKRFGEQLALPVVVREQLPIMDEQPPKCDRKPTDPAAQPSPKCDRKLVREQTTAGDEPSPKCDRLSPGPVCDRKFEIGDRVKVVNLSGIGEILEIKGYMAKISLEPCVFWMKLEFCDRVLGEVVAAEAPNCSLTSEGLKGTIEIKTIKGNRYKYLRYRENGKLKSKYLGKAASESV